jgi:LmbE family N-acetylglucosaminyl deacetylase
VTETLEGPEAPEAPTTPDPHGPVLAVFAHPDDMEIACGGSVAKWAAAGRPVHLLILTNGDRGSQDPAQDRGELARLRVNEQEDAAKVLGLAGFDILSTHDGELENTPEMRAEIARRVRTIRPVTVVTCDPTVWFFGNQYFNHSDHRTAGAVTLDALFPGAGNPHFFAEQLSQGLEPWSVPEIRIAWTLESNQREDITGFMDVKLAALFEHRSQLDHDQLAFFERWLTMEAEQAGKEIGVDHAESFRVMNLGSA